ncbi:MAG: c-type cytochrome biogenesis protein CcsB [Planctomycetota bacterium]
MWNLFINFSLGFYLTALIGGTIHLVTKNRRFNLFFLIAISTGLVSNISAVFIRWLVAGYSPMSNMYETLICLSAILVGIFIYLNTKQSIPLVGILVAFFAVTIMVLTNLFDRSIHSLSPALKSNWLTVHVLLCMTGYAALTISFISGLTILLKPNKPVRTETISASFKITYESVKLGFFFLTLGILTGAVWAEQTWGTYWSWDPKESWALITWLIFAVYLHGQRLLNWSPRRLSWITVAGFGAMLFTYFGVSFILTGLHTYA